MHISNHKKNGNQRRNCGRWCTITSIPRIHISQFKCCVKYQMFMLRRQAYTGTGNYLFKGGE